MRFDCRQINDIQLIRLVSKEVVNQEEEKDSETQTVQSLFGESQKSHSQIGEKKVLFMIAACNDNYIRFFNLQGIKLVLAFKSKDHNGAPLCFDVSPDR